MYSAYNDIVHVVCSVMFVVTLSETVTANLNGSFISSFSASIGVRVPDVRITVRAPVDMG